MPREQIPHNPIIECHTSPAIDGVASARAHVEQARRNLHVVWNRSGGSGAFGVQHDIGRAQLGLDATVAEHLQVLAYAELEAADADQANADFGDYDVDAHQFRVTPDVIDRRETNLAITTLYRARERFFTATISQPPTDEQRATVKAINDAVGALAVVIEEHTRKSRSRSSRSRTCPCAPTAPFERPDTSYGSQPTARPLALPNDERDLDLGV